MHVHFEWNAKRDRFERKLFDHYELQAMTIAAALVGAPLVTLALVALFK
jgi:hypothetical protein